MVIVMMIVMIGRCWRRRGFHGSRNRGGGHDSLVHQNHPLLPTTNYGPAFLFFSHTVFATGDLGNGVSEKRDKKNNDVVGEKVDFTPICQRRVKPTTTVNRNPPEGKIPAAGTV